MPVQKPGRSKQDYGTPWVFAQKVCDRLGISKFDCDLAATIENRKCGRFYAPPDYPEQPPKWEPFILGRNSLIHSWKVGDGWNWLNPPFGNITPFVEKAWKDWQQFGARTAVLIPASIGAKWWWDWVHEKCHVSGLYGRLTFEGTPVNVKTGKQDPYPKDCALLLYGSERNDYGLWDWKKGKFR